LFDHASRHVALLCSLVLVLSFDSLAMGQTGRIDGEVLSSAGDPLPSVTITLYASGNVTTRVAVSDESGRFEFAELPPAIYTPVAVLPGFEHFIHSPIRLGEGETVSIHINLRLAYSEVVSIEELALTQSNEPITEQKFSSNILEVLPLPSDRFQEAMPLLPGVVRGPGGRINFNGTRSAQSMLLVNGSNATDPLTGEFAFELPLRAVDTVEVHSIPYSAEFGNVTAAVANVVTRAGGDQWEVDFGSLLPSLKWRDGKIQGIGSATPRVQVGGPLLEDKLGISQAVDYRFVRSRVYEDVVGEDEEVVENFDSFTQLDWQVNDVHSVTATFSYFPVEIDNWGLSVLQPESATPEFHSSGWNVAVAERAVTSSNTAWETLVAFKRYDVRVTPAGEGSSILGPDGLRANYFNEIDRESAWLELKSSFTRFFASRFGEHVLKVGGHFSHATFDGIDESGVIETRGPDGALLRRTEFLGSPEVGASDWVLAGFLQDEWRPTSQLGLDVGVRYDYERITGKQHLSPRLAMAFSPWENGGTILKGGWGAFYDHVFLHAGDFDSLQTRMETEFAADGGPTGPPLVFRNIIDPEGLDVPRTRIWNAELNQALGEDWLVRVKYQERRGGRELVVDRLEDAPAGPTLLLSSSGSSSAREFDVTMRRALPSDGNLFFSYVKSRASGHLNDFVTLYGDRRRPILIEDEGSLQPFDVPHRFLAWGTINLPHGITIAPGVEWRSGFPYTVFTEDYEVVGERNRGGRFPTFFSTDLSVIKALRLKGKSFRVGFQIFNLTDHYNPRDVYGNQASANFGEFADSVDFSIRARLGFDF
jgi:hypothetical protein